MDLWNQWCSVCYVLELGRACDLEVACASLFASRRMFRRMAEAELARREALS